MTYMISSGLLAASMLLGQTGEPPVSGGKVVVPAGPTVQQAQQTQRPILGWFQREDRPVLNRIQGWFKRDQPETSPAPKLVQPPRGTIRQTEPPPLVNPPVPNDFPRKLPNPTSQAPTKVEPITKETPAAAKEIQQISVQPTPAAATAKSPILPQLANKIGRDEKFEWVTGQLEIENGNYVLYYATPETVDRYNGRILLAPQQADMSQFRRGDLVSIRGQLVQRPTAQGMIPIYRITHASLIERPKS